ncbi:hypothetical protein L6164_012716 [Bauhinia variegata]|uniref:Uncharacterized protein n=1 Tax=Bauhinia variegata TaxID=167791 RepID=A0ACB9P9X5_BAUVA|nr:hypothetical protein L6164_012716 [Bauhinia variegata]
MALMQKSVALLMVMAVMGFSEAAVYKVGESSGWTTIGSIDYNNWAATKNFKLGDIIIFEYNSQFHNVMRVTHEMYKSCNATSPIATFTTGNDSIKITNYGHHFFFCGVPGHCQAGQKVDINVPRPSSSRAPSPSSSSLASPIVPVVDKVPAPSPSNAASTFIALKAGFGVMGLLIPLFALAI